MKMKSTLAYTLLPALVAAHGHVEKVIADGKEYQGWNAAFKYQTPIPATVGWQADNLDNGFVTPDRFGTVDIVCHKLGKSNGAYVPVKPGSKVTFKWVCHLHSPSASPSLLPPHPNSNAEEKVRYADTHFRTPGPSPTPALCKNI